MLYFHKKVNAFAGFALAAILLLPTANFAQQTDDYDYHESTKMLIHYGTQALMICNGLFVSHRTLEQIYEQELKLNRMPLLPPSMLTIDKERRMVTVGGGSNNPVPAMRAVYREGLGAVIMAPHQTIEEIDKLPVLEMPPLPGDPAKIPWPDGDLVPEKPLPKNISQQALDAAGEWAFDRKMSCTCPAACILLIIHGAMLWGRA